VHVLKDERVTRPTDLRRHLARFNLASTLKVLGEISVQTEHQHSVLEDVVVQSEAGPYIGRIAIEVATDDVDRVPGPADLSEAFRIYNGLQEPKPRDQDKNSWAIEHLVRAGHGQVARGGDLLFALARTWLLYTTIWAEVESARGFDIGVTIKDEIGLSLEQVMALGFAYGGQSVRGQLVPYDAKALQLLAPSLGIEPKHNEKFLDWISATYAEIRSWPSSTPPDSTYEKYALSPFLMKPAIRPDRLPPEAASNSLVVPVPRFLPVRVTDGIYHSLATAHQGKGKSNRFRTAFGHVFEAYVGKLLRAGSGSAVVHSERVYGPVSSRLDSPDWIVVEGSRLVVVEVKASSLALSTKELGDLVQLKKDLELRLTKGVQQLTKFAADVLGGSYSDLADLAHVSEIELLLVVHGDLAWGNWVLRDMIAAQVPGAASMHLCNIVEFECLQERCWGASPFELLATKRASTAHAFNFSDWLRTMPSTVERHPYLETLASSLIASWGIKRDAGLNAPPTPALA